ncbi:mas-related G-protein coupled receptor member H-like [Erythrolamprus reginae]|uniref:mas-related G-protein coupled receptor member H-like n=1 Tax=Erythrolamprus reginae TaxID=121349 RepID=UPI00396C6234
MTNSSSGNLDTIQSYYEYYNASDSYENVQENTLSDLGWIIWLGIIFITCCIGLMGNGYIIWLLGFQIKRNSFTAFILNLAIADFGYLATDFIYYIDQFADFQESKILFLFCVFFSHMMYTNSNFLLTAISVDRCVAVLFPIWHHCSRPKKLSSSICVLLWFSSFLMSGSMCIMLFTHVFYKLFGLHFLVTSLVCLPLITLSTVVLFIKVCLKPKQKNQGRLLLMILVTLLCFLLLAFPLSVLAMIVSFSSTKTYNQLKYWVRCGKLFSCLNSSINPVVYFLVGRKKAQAKESMKVILQKIFKEGETTGGNKRREK